MANTKFLPIRNQLLLPPNLHQPSSQQNHIPPPSPIGPLNPSNLQSVFFLPAFPLLDQNMFSSPILPRPILLTIRPAGKTSSSYYLVILFFCTPSLLSSCHPVSCHPVLFSSCYPRLEDVWQEHRRTIRKGDGMIGHFCIPALNGLQLLLDRFLQWWDSLTHS